MLAATLLLLGVDLSLHESTAVIFKEGHAIEVLSAVLLASAAASASMPGGRGSCPGRGPGGGALTPMTWRAGNGISRSFCC